MMVLQRAEQVCLLDGQEWVVSIVVFGGPSIAIKRHLCLVEPGEAGRWEIRTWTGHASFI